VGWGDFGVYGGGTATPRIDALACEGIRFNNYSVEAQCTPTRSAIMTGRQSVRSGTFKVPLPGEGASGLAPWEYTIAELLSDAGYATSLFGKWHCGDTEGRLPTDQGFDEWWGYRNSADEAGWTSYATFEAIAKAKGIQAPQIWEGKKGDGQTAGTRVEPGGAPVPGRADRRAGDRLHHAAGSGKQAVFHLHRAVTHAPEAGAVGGGEGRGNRLIKPAELVGLL